MGSAIGQQNSITEVTRRDMVESLLQLGSFHGRIGLMDFLRRVWDLSTMPSTDVRFDNADGDIWQHMVNNSDWDDRYLLYDYLDIVGCPDEVFGRFLEAYLHPVVQPSPYATISLAQTLSDQLKADGFELAPAPPISGRPVFRIRQLGTTALNPPTNYELVLSFAGEEREFVEAIATVLRASKVSLFYDKFENATLWGKDLVEHLHKVYAGPARYCVMFISKAYAEKVWPTHERRSAFEKAINEREEYILPARFDDTEIPGLRKTICYINLREETPESFASLILQKLGHR